MKQLIFLFLLMSNTQYTLSQEYVPMAVDSATWLLGTTGENPETDNLIVLRLEGDTIVDDIIYAKMYHYDMENNILSQDSRRLLGLLRDDIDERKVYGGLLNKSPYNFLKEDVFCDWGENDIFIEQLLYDFGLQEGDTLSSCMFSNSPIISSFDTVPLFGFQRRRLKFNVAPYFITEGIGTCMGIFKGEDCIIAGGYYANSLFNYCIGSFSDCSIITATKEENVSDLLIVYPNPVSNRLIIDSSLDIAQLTLLDTHGRVLNKFTNTNYIDMVKYPNGTYILKAEGKDGKTFIKRVIKH